MFTTDFSKTPIQGHAEAIVLAEGRSSAGRRDGVTWRSRKRDGSIPFEVLTVDTVEHAEAIAASHAARTVVLIAEARGYTNGVWRAEQQFPMAHNEHFHQTSSEERAGRTPPRIADGIRKPRRRAQSAAPRRWTIFDTGSMFLGATRYRQPFAWAITGRYWGSMVGKMMRMSGSVWHGIYWEWPWTLGTLANYRTRDDMLRFARMPEHRHLMQWIVSGTVHGNGGFIRLYATREELERQRTEGASAAEASGQATEPVVLRPVTTEADFQEFLAVPRRGDPAHLAVPLLEDTLRSWREGSAASGEPVDLYLAARGGETVGRTTIHRDARLDAKLGTTATLFGATWAAAPDDLRGLLAAIEQRARDDGAAEAFGPASLLPNQVGGVITSGFDERGFMDSPWNASWVPGVYEDVGFSRWGEADSWIARLGADRDTDRDTDRDANRDADREAPQAPAAAELERAGIRIRRASRIRYRRDVRALRRLTNDAFEQLPYYTEISPAEMRVATDGLIALMDPALWLFAEDRTTGEPIAFVLAVPDITPLLQRSGGKVGARELLEIVRARAGFRMRGGARQRTPGSDAEPREAILLIHGALPSQQGRGVVSLLWRQLATNLHEGGYSTLRSTVIGRGNPASSRQLERLGGEPLHGHTYYRKRTQRAPGDAPELGEASGTGAEEGPAR